MTDLVKTLVLVGIGLALIYGGAVELVGWLRSRSRVREVTGVIVGHVSPAAAGPGNPSRSARIQFTAEDGRVVEVVSAAWSFPGGKVGQRVPVRYDPADPQGSADRAGVQSAKALVVSPILILVGIGLAVFGTTFL